MRVVCLSDTHNRHRAISVPDGDLVIHAGDMSNTGSDREIEDAMRWFAALPHLHKIIIAGNHDWLFDIAPKDAAALIPPGVHYLQDSGCTIDGFRCWGSPVQPWFLDYAFNRRRGSGINRHWARIPANTDIVITHGPPHGTLDLVEAEHQGCEMLRQRLLEIQPLLHVCGHLHENHQTALLGSTVVVNAAICDDRCRPVYAPIVVDLDSTRRKQAIG